MKRIPVWLLLAVLNPESARAEDACHGVAILKGVMSPSLLIAPAAVDKPESRACLEYLGKLLVARKNVLSVTVSVRVPDAQRLDKKPQQAGRAAADVLIRMGVPAERVSVVVPRAEAVEQPLLQFRFTERPLHPVARADLVEGEVTWSAETDVQVRLKPGEMVESGVVIRMKEADSLQLTFADGSALQFEKGTIIRLAQVEGLEGGARHADVEVIQGGLLVNIKQAPGDSWFRFSSGEQHISVVTGLLRVHREKDGDLRAEVLRGGAVLTGKTGTQEAAAGEGAFIRAAGVTEAARKLLLPPRVTTPLFGVVQRTAALKFDKVAGAARYRVEFARDAGFLRSPYVVTDPDTSTVIPPALTKGTYFWHVIPIDADGVWGQASKTHTFIL